MSVKKMNPSAILSKKMIVEALFDMLAVKSLSAISISEIAENALVDRRTFYRHFKSKNDVIRYYIHDVLIQYEQIISTYNAKDTYSLTLRKSEILSTFPQFLKFTKSCFH